MEKIQPKPFVFVLMPFSGQFTDIYYDGIKPACDQAGAYCERSDTQNFNESILQHIYDQISKADIIVADMTGQNPNVFYETGYAHALNKSVILLANNAEDIPFDLKHYNHIIYGGTIATLKSELEAWLLWYIDNPKVSLANVSTPPLIKLSPSVIEKQASHSIPREWGCRSLYLGLSGAKNWLAIVSDSNHYYYRADYFKEIVTELLAEDFLKAIEINTMVSLGPGNGVTDQILCQHLRGVKKTNYVPVDINPYLLAKSIMNVGSAAITQFGVVCDFEDEMISFLGNELHSHTKGSYLYTILGYTICNLDGSEVRFFANIRGLMRKGDYLLFDYIAIDDEWSYDEYSKIWYTEWDEIMRKFVCDAVSKRRDEHSKVLLSQFETRFSLERGRSDVKGSHATYIKDKVSGCLVTNIRRYQALTSWLQKTFKFEIIKEQIRIERQHAGYGYILVKRI